MNEIKPELVGIDTQVIYCKSRRTKLTVAIFFTLKGNECVLFVYHQTQLKQVKSLNKQTIFAAVPFRESKREWKETVIF